MTFAFYLLNTSGSGSRYFYFSPARLSRARIRQGLAKENTAAAARMIFFQPTPKGPDLAGYTGHGATFAGWEIK
ncbi:hypothetical protein [Bacteroides caecimuris]|uniref:hypothetical protein n=1 Tax=Bacteroides caecimuris TaxID=1796613 RepID=UPI00265A8E9B|nr:hypothetical protein [Bacteroides caecimuris]